MRRRKIDVENLGENTQISLKLPKKVLEWIEEACNDDSKFTGRSHFIDNACRYYLSLVPCPVCSTLNPRDANVCCNCKSPLQGMQNILEDIHSRIAEYEEIHAMGCEIADLITDLLNTIHDYINSLDPPTRVLIENELLGFGERCTVRAKPGIGYFDTYRKYLHSPDILKIPRTTPHLELTIPDFVTVLSGFADMLEKNDLACMGLVQGSRAKGDFETSALSGLFYYNIGKNILNGDNYSLNEIDNLFLGIDTINSYSSQYCLYLKESYDDLSIYYKMLQLLSDKKT